MLHMVALAMDLPLEMDTMYTLLHMPHQTQIQTQTLDIPTIHQLATVTAAHSHDHSWRVVTSFNQTKLKSSSRQLEE